MYKCKLNVKLKPSKILLKKKKKTVQDESINIFNIIKKIRGTNQ